MHSLFLTLLSMPLVHAEDVAEEEAITISSVQDIYPLLPPEGATKWDPTPVVEAVKASEFEFTPKHAYELVDNEVHPEIIKMVCAKAALFYDTNWKPLSQIGEDARRGQPPQTIQLGDADFVRLFEFFNDVQNEVDAAEARVGALAVQGPSESVSMFERRQRKRDEDLAKARAPHEGRIEATTFELTLTATPEEKDGCSRSMVSVDLSSISFDLFRLGMGVKQVSNDLEVAGSSLEAARFTTESPRRFEVIGRCGSKAKQLRMTMKRTHDGQWSGSGSL